jgi:hypothetical protein
LTPRPESDRVGRVLDDPPGASNNCDEGILDMSLVLHKLRAAVRVEIEHYGPISMNSDLLVFGGLRNESEPSEAERLSSPSTEKCESRSLLKSVDVRICNGELGKSIQLLRVE